MAILWTFLFFLILPLLILLLLVSHVWRLVVSKILVNSSDRLLTCLSALSGTDGIYTCPKYSLVVVSIFEGRESLEVIREAVSSRVVTAVGLDGKLKRPEFQKFVTSRLGLLVWSDEANFRIEDHVRVYAGKFKSHQELTPEMLMEVANDLTYKPFPKGTSPWEILILNNFRESPEAPLSTVSILHAHHCLGDGFAFLKMTLDLLQAPEPASPQWQGSPSPFCNAANLLKLAICAPYQLISEISNSIDQNSWHVEEGQLRRSLNSALSPPIPLAKIKGIRNLHKVTFTCVILNCFAGALRKFMTEGGYDVPTKIHCAVPLPMPQHPGQKMRNHLTACYVTLPVGLVDARSRLVEIQADLDRIKTSTFPATLFYAMSVIGGIFPALLRPLVRNTRTTALASSFPGPTTPLNFNGHQLSSIFFGGGLHNGRVGIGFSAVSCFDSIRFVFAVDEGLVSAREVPASRLVHYFTEALQELTLEVV